ncbi:unnamed protein product, partial [Iphiclides podalirius]
MNEEAVPTLDDTAYETKTFGLTNTNSRIFRNKESDDSGNGVEKQVKDNLKKPCAIVVLSNAQNPNMHSLLRKYRYDAKGVLIPSSVKYFVKLPNGEQSSTVLVPLHDKAFSPLGGFVRYYKEVPPIPQSW